MVEQLDYRVVRGYEAFNAIQPQMFAGFAQMFDRPYPAQLWDHFYRDCPCGPAVGITAWSGDQLVAISVLLSQELVDRDTDALMPYGLNVTAFILPEFRQGGMTYLGLMRHIWSLSETEGFRFLLAYPNENAYLPLTTMGRYQLVDSARFVRVDGDIGGYVEFLAQESKKSYFSDRMWKWRMGRFPYHIEDGCVVKEFQGERNVLDWLDVGSQATVSAVMPYWLSYGECPYEPVDDYVIRLCCLPIDQTFDVHSIKRSVMYSDVY